MKRYKLSVLAILLVSVITTGMIIAYAENNPGTTVFSSEISATTPRDGATVSLVGSSVRGFLNADATMEEINKYYFINDEMLAFPSVLHDLEKVRELYQKYDDFHPVNNVLRWTSSVDASMYTVKLALDQKFTQTVLIEQTTDTELNLGNLLMTGTKYYWQVIAATAGGEVRSNIFSFSTEDTLRTVRIDSVSNTRDIGGYGTPDGRTLQGLVYRGARLDDITEQGISDMNALGIKTDLDLRSEGEGAVNPSDRQNYIIKSSPYYAYGGAGIDSASYKNNLRDIMLTFAVKDNYPIYFHCSLGRDRTGTVAFLLNALLGVSYDDLMHDYFMSVFSVTGSWDKVVTSFYGNMANLVNYLDTMEGDTLSQKTENYLLGIGLTAGDIQSIKDIMLGRETVEIPGLVDNDASYENSCFVTFECYGHPRTVVAVASGKTVAPPFEIQQNYEWTADGQPFDFSTPISADMVISARKKGVCKVIVFADGESTVREYDRGQSADFSQFAKEGYIMKIISTSGDIITSLTVDDDLVVSIVYLKK